MKSYDVLYIGNYTKDTILSPAGTRIMDGGAVNYAAHAAARLGIKAAVITRLAREDQHVVEKFTQSGIDCYVTDTTQSTLLRLEYPTADPDVRTLSVTSIAGSITAQDVENISAQAAVIGSSLRGAEMHSMNYHFYPYNRDSAIDLICLLSLIIHLNFGIKTTW